MTDKSFQTWKQKQASEKDASAERIYMAVKGDANFLATLRDKLSAPKVAKNIVATTSTAGGDASTRDWVKWIGSMSDQDVNDLGIWLALEGLGGNGRTPLMKRSAKEISPICTSQLKIALRRAISEDPELAGIFGQESTGPKSPGDALLVWFVPWILWD